MTSATAFPRDFLDRLLAAVEGRDGKRKGQEVLFRCPSPTHEDTHPSARFHIQKEVWICDACGSGGGAFHLARLLGVDLPESKPLTVTDLAEAKGLDANLLRTWGVRDGRRYSRKCVVIEYRDGDGQVRGERYRLSLAESPITRKGDRARLYIGRLEPGPVLIVEGESDCWTLWQHGFNAVGVPGAASWRSEWAEALRDRELYVWREPDTGGDTLVAKIARDLPDVRIIDAPEKDASALWLTLRDAETFKATMGELMASATPAREIRAEALTREAREAWTACGALALDPNLLVRAEDAIRAGGYAGDTRPPMLAFLAITSRLGPKPINLHFLAASASGKTEAVNRGKALHPPSAYHEIGAGSARALVYDGDADYQHRTVIVAEADSIPEEGPAASAVRSLAEDAEMRYAVVERDEDTGRFETRHIVKPGPTGLITTSTRALDPQMATRMLTVSVNDSPDQTREILRAQAGGAMGDSPGAPDMAAFHALQRWLELAGVREYVIPFAGALAEAIPAQLVRVRRDFPQLLAMIGAVAILYQRQRERDGQGRIVASIEDYRHARRLLLDVFAETVSGGVSDVLRETVRAVAEMYEGAPVEMGALCERLDLHRATVWRRARTALRLGFLVNDETRRGQPAKLRPGAPLPEDRRALPEAETLEHPAAYRPETDATVQPDGDGPICAVSEEAVATRVAQPETPVQPGMQPGNEAVSDANPARNGGAVARLHADRGDTKQENNEEEVASWTL